MFEKNLKGLPELLAPAGSPAALEAAIAGGADAVYFGGLRHNARASATNFTEKDVAKSVRLAHAHKVKMYQTLNTLATDREMNDVLEDARIAYNCGVDALIVADFGVAAAIHRILPDFALHASTQASGHSVGAAAELEKIGFCRMVCAREMSLADIKTFTADSPLEAEVFVHGALCVCHSGQCLFSSLVGGRSGNRGECAQPCRLPYKNGRNRYPLSLKDLSLAKHIPDLIDARVASLKIEGRMKSPEYVFAVTKVFRRLLDERRAATDSEMGYLASVFSRGGFTDGYFTGHIDSHMMGIRSEHEKDVTRTLENFEGLKSDIPIEIKAEIQENRPMEMSICDGMRTVRVTGDIPEKALKTPSEHDAVLRNLTKFGNTPFSVAKAELFIGSGLAVPVSKLNALRRRAVDAYFDMGRGYMDSFDYSAHKSARQKKKMLSARFVSPDAVTDKAREYFDVIYLPLWKYDGSTKGIIIPPVVFDSEKVKVLSMLDSAVKMGAKYALVGNLGHIGMARDAGLRIQGDFRFNVTNSETVCVLEKAGVEGVILSPELTLPQLRDIKGETSAVAYGRIPLMLLEKCVGKEISGCENCAKGKIILTDRKGISFPVLREWEHRSVIYNSVVTCMSDREDALDRAGIQNRHFIFSDETPSQVDAVIDAYINGRAPVHVVRRI